MRAVEMRYVRISWLKTARNVTGIRSVVFGISARSIIDDDEKSAYRPGKTLSGGHFRSPAGPRVCLRIVSVEK